MITPRTETLEYFYNFEKLDKELQKKVICNIFFFNNDLQTVSTNWKIMLKGFIHHPLPFQRRDEIIHHLFSKSCIFFKQENKLNDLVTNYCNSEFLPSNSTVKFFYDWLAFTPQYILNIEDETDQYKALKNQLNGQALKLKFHSWKELLLNYENSLDSNKYLNSLLEAKEIEKAFAYAARIDEIKNNNKRSLMVQEFFHDKEKGLGLSIEDAYKLTEALNTEKTRIPALIGFIAHVSKLLDISTVPLHKLIENPLIVFLKNYEIKNLPDLAAILLIEKINLLLAQEHDSFETSDIRDDLVRILFKNISKEFDFYAAMDEGSRQCSDLIDHYQQQLMDVAPVSNMRLSEEDEEEFIDSLNAIPCCSLKEQIYANIMDYFYSQKPDMHYWVDILERIETETKQPRERAREELIFHCINEGLDKFKAYFSKPKYFKRLIMLLKAQSDWFNRIEIKGYEKAKGVYTEVGNLLNKKNKKDLLLPLLDNIKSPNLKEEMKVIFNLS